VPAVNKGALNAAKIAIIAFSLCFGIALAAGLLIDQSLLDRVEKKYGAAAKQRFVDWQSLIENGKSWPEAEKLERVNNFFNGNVEFVDDIILWQKNRLLGGTYRVSG